MSNEERNLLKIVALLVSELVYLARCQGAIFSHIKNDFDLNEFNEEVKKLNAE